MLSEEDWSNTGVLASVCARIVMKILFMARFYRYDLLFAVNSLARYLTKWNKACDKKLLRLICYINSTKDMVLVSHVGDPISRCHVALFSDADFAGDVRESKSTSGCFVAVIGPNTFAPVGTLCKTQSCVSHSSTESEIVALDFALRSEGLPLLTLMQFLADSDSPSNPNHVPRMVVLEDNEAVIKIVLKRRSMALRHVLRTHRISIDWCFEVCSNCDVFLKYVRTTEQCADMMTKGFSKKDVWNTLLNLIGLVPSVAVCSSGRVPTVLFAIATSPDAMPSDQNKAKKKGIVVAAFGSGG
jgi:hypothetical protein